LAPNETNCLKKLFWQLSVIPTYEGTYEGTYVPMYIYTCFYAYKLWRGIYIIAGTCVRDGYPWLQQLSQIIFRLSHRSLNFNGLSHRSLNFNGLSHRSLNFNGLSHRSLNFYGLIARTKLLIVC
jgi:hypothetical protein